MPATETVKVSSGSRGGLLFGAAGVFAPEGDCEGDGAAAHGDVGHVAHRRLNEGDLFVWNGFASKLGWRDSVTPRLEERKHKMGIADRHDIACIPDLIDFDEGRLQ